MKRFSLLILSILFFCQLMAQYESAGKPLKFSAESAGLKRSLSSFYVDIQADTTKIPTETQGRKLISGVTSNVDISMNDGVTFVEEGLKVWRVGVKSKNAKGISLFFDRFLLPEGGKLFVYNPDQSIVFGAFTSENNNSENKLLIRPLSSDSLVVEYLEPLNASFKADLHISLATHEMRSVNQFLKSMTDLNGHEVYCIAATNRLEALDEAFTRSGRFGEWIKVDAPDLDGTIQILDIHTKGKPLDSDLDKMELAKEMNSLKMTGADIAVTVADAHRNAYRRAGIFKAMRDKTYNPMMLNYFSITKEDFEKAIEPFKDKKKSDRKPIGFRQSN